ncbi:hypothetical protein PybrP1_007081 [[Pythium] brassicae (nom. inval.)]|nr:hypothetical protein PybrP1_007081 [[Pythium] brassicae (nom. inval.)]
MGSVGSKAQTPEGGTTTTTSTSNNSSQSAAVSRTDEAIGMIIDGIVLYGMFVSAKYLYATLKPMVDEFREGEGGKAKLHRRLGRSNRPVFRTTHYEEIVAGDIVDPQDIDVSFADIGGLEHQKRDIYDLVVLPLKNPDTIMSKWFGESQKLVRAAFSLARKLAPCIIFIDEVDSFMGKRGGASDPTFASMKTEFLALWDGFTDVSSAADGGGGGGFGVLVMGATNRPGDVDPAFLRRMPRSFEIGLPDRSQREQILRINLRSEPVERAFDFHQLSVDTVHYSGSDLKELCRAALMIPLREHIERVREAATAAQQQQQKHGQQEQQQQQQPAAEIAMRPLCMDDFEEAKHMVKPTGAAAYAYEAASQDAKPPAIDMELFAAVMAAGLQNMMQGSSNGGGGNSSRRTR